MIREGIAGTLQEFVIDAVNESMLNRMLQIFGSLIYIFNIIDSRISFYRNNLDLLQPKPKLRLPSP